MRGIHTDPDSPKFAPRAGISHSCTTGDGGESVDATDVAGGAAVKSVPRIPIAEKEEASEIIIAEE